MLKDQSELIHQSLTLISMFAGTTHKLPALVITVEVVVIELEEGVSSV